MAKVLVTGGAGFIGFHLTKALLARGDEVVSIDNLNDYYDPQLKLDRLNALGLDMTAIMNPTELSSPQNTLNGPEYNDEIDLIELFQNLWDQKWLITATTPIYKPERGGLHF